MLWYPLVVYKGNHGNHLNYQSEVATEDGFYILSTAILYFSTKFSKTAEWLLLCNKNDHNRVILFVLFCYYIFLLDEQ